MITLQLLEGLFTSWHTAKYMSVMLTNTNVLTGCRRAEVLVVIATTFQVKLKVHLQFCKYFLIAHENLGVFLGVVPGSLCGKLTFLQLVSSSDHVRFLPLYLFCCYCTEIYVFREIREKGMQQRSTDDMDVMEHGWHLKTWATGAPQISLHTLVTAVLVLS